METSSVRAFHIQCPLICPLIRAFHIQCPLIKLRIFPRLRVWRHIGVGAVIKSTNICCLQRRCADAPIKEVSENDTLKGYRHSYNKLAAISVFQRK